MQNNAKLFCLQYCYIHLIELQVFHLKGKIFFELDKWKSTTRYFNTHTHYPTLNWFRFCSPLWLLSTLKYSSALLSSDLLGAKDRWLGGLALLDSDTHSLECQRNSLGSWPIQSKVCWKQGLELEKVSSLGFTICTCLHFKACHCKQLHTFDSFLLGDWYPAFLSTLQDNEQYR